VSVKARACNNANGKEVGTNFVCISVQDTGNGISAEDIGKLFKEFGQANNDKARQFAGTGLGLCICKELVELHGGEIWVESVLGQGSTFAFTLPATTEEAVHADGDDYEPSTDTLDELFGGDGSRTSWGTGSFRYGTGARGSLSAMLQLHSMKSSKSMQSASYLGRKKGAADGEADMKAEPWYRGVMSREQATEFLSTFPAGSFLVRKGNSGFVISVRYFKEGSGGDASTAEVTAYHFLINMEGVAEQRASTMSTGRSDWEGTLKYSVEADTKFDSISGLIQHYMKYPESFFENMADAPQITGYRLMPVAQVDEVVE